jgi:hypothetical protein
MTSVIASIIDKYLMMLPGDRNMMEREFTRLETTVRDVGTAVGQSGHITRVTAGNVIFGETDGIKLLNPSIGRYSIDLQSDGDAFFGSDTSAPDHTALAIFSNSQRYNGELFGAGDLLIGDNSAGKANLQWDASTGRLNFRGGATTNAYISAAGYLNATGATISGTITAAAGSIGGWTINADNIAKTGIILDSGDDAIYVGASAPRLVIDGANKVIKSSSYASGVSGFSINGATGDAEFNNITARGEIRTAVLAYGEIQATAGTLGVFKSAGKLREDRMTQANFNIDIEDPATGHMQLFAVNDILRIKDTSGDFWLRVDGVSNLGTYYRYAVTLMNGSTGATIKAGAAVVDYGPGGTGFITLSADGTVGSSANITIAAHTGSPWSAQTTLVRLGNLNGSYGMVTDRYGIGIGDYANNNFIRYQNGALQINTGSGRTVMGMDGLYVTDADSNAVLGVACVDSKSWGGLTLNTGDIMFGYYGATAGGWVLFNRDGDGAGKPLLTLGAADKSVLWFDSGGATINGVLDISTSGGIFQGTGTFASPQSALKIYNNAGVGNIEMWGVTDVIDGPEYGKILWLNDRALNLRSTRTAGEGSIHWWDLESPVTENVRIWGETITGSILNIDTYPTGPSNTYPGKINLNTKSSYSGGNVSFNMIGKGPIEGDGHVAVNLGLATQKFAVNRGGVEKFSVDGDGLLSCAEITTNGGGHKWDLYGFTAGADAASNGYVNVYINGTLYKLMTRA